MSSGNTTGTKRNMFENTDFEKTYNELKEIENYQKAWKVTSLDNAKCYMPGCDWTGKKQTSFRSHVQNIHKKEYDSLRFGNAISVNYENDNLINPSGFDESEHSLPNPEQILTNSEFDFNTDNDEIFVSTIDEVISFFDEFLLLDDDKESNSTFLNKVGMFSLEKQKAMISFFNKIVELRWLEVVPESVYIRIAQGVHRASMALVAKLFKEDYPQMINLCDQFVSSLYLQKEYLKSLGNVIEPVTVQLDNFTYQYVPIKEIAKLVLKNQSLVNEILREQSPDFRYEFTDYSNELTCGYIRWCRIKGKFRIQIYSDEFVIVNPIGASKHEHKYLAVYCCFINLPLKDRMKRNDRFLLLIANHKEIDCEVLNNVFERLFMDLLDLELNGIDLSLANGKVLNIPCILSSIVADNLAHYQMIGSPIHFGMYFCCRICAATYEEIQNPNLHKRCLGSPADIETYIKLIEKANGINLPVNEFGLKRVFMFHWLPSVDGIWDLCPLDILHDVCEGIFPRLISFILIEICQIYRISKETMVNMINSYQFYDVNFNISSIKEGFSIGGDAVQRTELFIRLQQILLKNFPMIQDKPIFHLYLAMKRVAVLSFKVSISNSQIEELDNNARLVLKLVKEINVDFKITPKLHNITHYAFMIRKFGPLINYSTLAYERKHAFFKRWARVMNNHINPALSLANRHQFYMVLSFDAKCFAKRQFVFDNRLSSDPSLSTFPKSELNSQSHSILSSGERPFKLNKHVIRQIGSSNLWIEATEFWRIGNQIYAEGAIFEKSAFFESTFPILRKINDSKYVLYEDLYHVNDFVEVMNSCNILIAGIL